MLEAQVAPFVITRNGKDEVVVMSYALFEQLLEDSVDSRHDQRVSRDY